MGDAIDSTLMHINDLPRSNLTLTRHQRGLSRNMIHDTLLLTLNPLFPLILVPNFRPCPLQVKLSCQNPKISQLLANIYNLSVIQGKHPSKLNVSTRLCKFIKIMMSSVPVITGLFLHCLYSLKYLKTKVSKTQ